MNIYEVDFTRAPYKGVFAEIAREIDKSPVTVWQGFRRRSPKYVKLVKEKVSDRMKIIHPIMQEAV